MEPDLNPYRPGSGRPPGILAGRDEDLAAFDRLIARTKLGHPDRSFVFSGLRGVGKTVLLNRLRSSAEHHGFAVIQFEATSGEQGRLAARRSLAAGLAKASSAYRADSRQEAARQILSTVQSFSVTVGLTGLSMGVERDLSKASSGLLELDLQDVVDVLTRQLRKERRGLFLFIDELQELDDELLGALLTVQHYSMQFELPFYVVGAGLPNLPARLSEIRTYAERLFDYREIGQLDDAAAREALVQPARSVGGEFTPDALRLVMHEAGNYPYFLQVFGHAMWVVAQASPFTIDNGRAAAEFGRSRLDAGFFPARWERATPAERDYLVAMAHDQDGVSASSAISERLNASAAMLSARRASLIDKGIIYSPQRGTVAFTVPGMAAFIERRRSALED